MCGASKEEPYSITAKDCNDYVDLQKGILAKYDCHISTSKVDGINNKIKVIK